MYHSFFFQAGDGIRDFCLSRGLGDVYKKQDYMSDIVIIGAGAVGTAIAREFSKYQVRVMVVDKRDDVGGRRL